MARHGWAPPRRMRSASDAAGTGLVRATVASLEETRTRGLQHALEDLGRDGPPGAERAAAASDPSRWRRERRGRGRRRTGGPVGLGVAYDAGTDRDPEREEQHRASRERGRVAPGGARVSDPPRWRGRRGRRGAEAVELGENRRGLALVPGA